MPTLNEYIGELFVICREQRDRIEVLDQENRALAEAMEAVRVENKRLAAIAKAATGQAEEGDDGAAGNGTGIGGGVDGVQLRQRPERVATGGPGG